MRFNVLIAIACWCFHVNGFNSMLPKTWLATKSASALFSNPPVSSVAVCTAELCCCQDDALGGDEIFANLKAKALPYPIDEAPCLGACGGGAMVVIDFEDGTSALVTGWDETLLELGVVEDGSKLDSMEEKEAGFATKATTPSPSSASIHDEMMSTSKPEQGKSMGSSELQSHDSATAIHVVASSDQTASDAVSNKSVPSKEVADVRVRMRVEAEADSKAENPWLKAASYLAKKAAEKLAGAE